MYPSLPALTYSNFTFVGNVDTKSANQARYAVFSCKTPSLVMRSSNGVDLAVVSFRHDADNSTKNLHIPRPTQLANKINGNRTRIQVLMDINNAPLCISITNLCNDMIKFDFMKKDKKVSETDPPENLNQVNEICPMQTYNINADQTRESRQIIINKKISSVHKSGITLEKEENAPDSDKFGDYLYLQMSCKSGSSIEKYFDGAKWFVTNYISVEQLPMSTDKFSSTPQMAKFKSFLSRGGSSNNEAYITSYEGYTDCEGYDSCVLGDKYMGIVCNNKKESGKKPFLSEEVDVDVDVDADVDVDVPNAPAEVDTQHINKSYVGEIVSGEKIYVRSNTSGITYNYTLDTQIAVIEFSVVENSVFDFTSKTDCVEYSHYTERLLGGELMHIKIYEQDICILCMTDRPNNIMYPCGHNCLCHGCCGEFKKCDSFAKKVECPVCRSNVFFTFVTN